MRDGSRRKRESVCQSIFFCLSLGSLYMQHCYVIEELQTCSAPHALFLFLCIYGTVSLRTYFEAVKVFSSCQICIMNTYNTYILYIHTYTQWIHTYLHTIHTYTQLNTYLLTYNTYNTYIHTIEYILTYIQYIHTHNWILTYIQYIQYIHTNTIHTYTQLNTY